ncbi:MAG: twin-arginine translocase subunit TatC [Candidatus Marinamargulisbacteria bacterium]
MTVQELPLSAHIDELRQRIIKSFIGIALFSVFSYFFYDNIATFFLSPLSSVSTNGGSINVNTIYEGFFVKLKLSIIAGVILSLPITLFQICRFVIPGLKKGEIKWLFIILLTSATLSGTSTFLGYTIVLPYIVTFLLDNNFIPQNINVLLNYKQNVSYIIAFLTGAIIVFQSPILLSILLAKDIITRSFLLKNSRFFILGIVITSAMVTPPDIVSQLCLAIPLIGCYFGCIGFAKLMKWGASCSE